MLVNVVGDYDAKGGPDYRTTRDGTEAGVVDAV